MSDQSILRQQARGRHRERSRANARALAGAGIGEDEVLEAMNRWHLAVLEQPLAGGGIQIHLGLARYGKGIPFCTAGHPQGHVWAREGLGAFRSPYFSMKLPEQQRWWCGIVWLEQNRGCQECVARAYQWADEQGWKQPKRLAELLDLGAGTETLGPARGAPEAGGARFTDRGFTRGATTPAGNST